MSAKHKTYQLNFFLQHKLSGQLYSRLMQSKQMSLIFLLIVMAAYESVDIIFGYNMNIFKGGQ